MWHQIRPHRKCPRTHKPNHFGDHLRLHFRSRFLGPPKKKVAGPGSLPPEVRLFLTWARYLIRRGYGPTKSIWINLDESALPIHVGGRFGNVVMLGKEQKLSSPRGGLCTNDERMSHWWHQSVPIDISRGSCLNSFCQTSQGRRKYGPLQKLGFPTPAGWSSFRIHPGG